MRLRHSIIVILFLFSALYGLDNSNNQIQIRLLVLKCEDCLSNFPPATFSELLKNELFRNQIEVDTLSISDTKTAYDDIVYRYRTQGYDHLKPKNSTENSHFIVQLNLIPQNPNQIDVKLQWIDIRDTTVSRLYGFMINERWDKLLTTAARRIAQSLNLNLRKKIRIAIAPFIPMMGDTVDKKINHSIRYLLGTSLSKIPWIGIVDVEIDSLQTTHFLKQRRLQQKAGRLGYEYLSETAIESGQLVFPNYIIYGNILSIDNGLRLDCWLVSMESQLIIAADGIAIKELSLEDLGANTQELANRLSKAIELEYVLGRKPPQSVAVIPSRNLKLKPYYAKRAIEVISALNRKLRAMLNIERAFLLEDYGILKDYLFEKEEFLEYDQFLRRFNADNVLILDIEETDERFFLNIAFQSLKDPRSRPRSKKAIGEIFFLERSVDTMLTSIAKYDSTLFKKYPEGRKGDIFKGTSIPHFFKNYRINFNVGQIARWKSGQELFLDDKANRMITISLEIKVRPFLRKNRYWGFGFSGGWDRGGLKFPHEFNLPDSVGKFEVTEWFLSGYLMADIFRFEEFQIYGGIGPSVFFITRKLGVGTNLRTTEDHVRFGGNVFLNLESKLFQHHKVNSYLNIRFGLMISRLTTETRMQRPGLEEIDLTHDVFKRGFLGGPFVSGGLSFSFRP